MVVTNPDWPSLEVLEANRARLLAEARRAIASFEARFGMSSDEMTSQVKAGEVFQSAEICDWFMNLEDVKMLCGGE